MRLAYIMKRPMIERTHERAHQRVAVDAFVRVVGESREYVFRTRDLSEGGLFLFTRVGHLYPFYVGSELSVELYDFDQAVTFKAKVVRIVERESDEAERYPLGFAVQIEGIDDKNRVKLASVIARARSGDPLY